jgi:hypothetical protein
MGSKDVKLAVLNGEHLQLPAYWPTRVHALANQCFSMVPGARPSFTELEMALRAAAESTIAANMEDEGLHDSTGEEGQGPAFRGFQSFAEPNGAVGEDSYGVAEDEQRGVAETAVDFPGRIRVNKSYGLNHDEPPQPLLLPLPIGRARNSPGDKTRDAALLGPAAGVFHTSKV